MKWFFVLVSLLAITGIATAEKPDLDIPALRTDVECGLTNVVYDWDFAAGDHGFTTGICEDGGLSAFEYGTTTLVPGAPGDVWGTVLNGPYESESGGSLIAPAFTVDGSTAWMEIYHYFDIETTYDGGNVTVNGEVILPVSGYPSDALSTSDSYYAWCVDLEPGYTGHDAVWAHSCFDLSAFAGHEIVVAFDFGSDSSVTYPGWYIASVKIGSAGDTATEEGTWGTIKGMFK